MQTVGPQIRPALPEFPKTMVFISRKRRAAAAVPEDLADDDELFSRLNVKRARSLDMKRIRSLVLDPRCK